MKISKPSRFTFEDLKVWQRSIKLSKNIYKLTNTFPETEKYGITNQIRRAVVSISLNIAEGKGRSSNKELLHFLTIARGSLYEVISCLEISLSCGFINKDCYDDLKSEGMGINYQLNALMSYIRNSKK